MLVWQIQKTQQNKVCEGYKRKWFKIVSYTISTNIELSKYLFLSTSCHIYRYKFSVNWSYLIGDLETSKGTWLQKSTQWSSIWQLFEVSWLCQGLAVIKWKYLSFFIYLLMDRDRKILGENREKKAGDWLYIIHVRIYWW